MPALSPTMTKGNVAAWKKKEGESFRAGEVLCDIETDKAVMALEAQDDGVLAKILVPAGAQDVPFGQLLAVIVDDKASVASFASYKPEAEPAKPPPAASAASAATAIAAP